MNTRRYFPRNRSLWKKERKEGRKKEWREERKKRKRLIKNWKVEKTKTRSRSTRYWYYTHRARWNRSVQGIYRHFSTSAGQTYASEPGSILRRRPSISAATFSTKDPRKEHTHTFRIHARVRARSFGHCLWISNRSIFRNEISIVRRRPGRKFNRPIFESILTKDRESISRIYIYWGIVVFMGKRGLTIGMVVIKLRPPSSLPRS